MNSAASSVMVQAPQRGMKASSSHFRDHRLVRTERRPCPSLKPPSRFASASATRSPRRALGEFSLSIGGKT
jgi:hypothetical protein